MSDLSDLIRNIKATHGKTPAFEMHGLLYECLGAFETLQRELDALKHDIARHVAIASEEATRADGLRAALQEAIDLRTILYCNGCDECEEGICSGNPVKNDPYAKKWSAALQSGRKP